MCVCGGGGGGGKQGALDPANSKAKDFKMMKHDLILLTNNKN